MSRELPLELTAVRFAIGLILVVIGMLMVLLFSGDIGMLPNDVEELLFRLLLLALVVLIIFVVSNR